MFENRETAFSPDVRHQRRLSKAELHFVLLRFHSKIFSFQLFEYERVVQILLNGVADVNQEGFVQRIAIYLLNSLACQVDGKQKTFLGNQGAIGVSTFILYFYFTSRMLVKK